MIVCSEMYMERCDVNDLLMFLTINRLSRLSLKSLATGCTPGYHVESFFTYTYIGLMCVCVCVTHMNKEFKK